LFSTSVELQSDNMRVCVCVCVCPKTLEQPGEDNNSLIMLKFDTRGLDELGGVFFHFLKILLLELLDPFLPKTLRQRREVKC